MRTLRCGPYTVELFTETDCQTVVYAVMDQTEAQAVWSLLREPKPALAAISGAGTVPVARTEGVSRRQGLRRGRPGLSGCADRTDCSADGSAAGLCTCLPGRRRVFAGRAVRAVVCVSNGCVRLGRHFQDIPGRIARGIEQQNHLEGSRWSF